MRAANWGMLASGVICGSIALMRWSFEWFMLGLWLVLVQLFWCFGLYLIIQQYGVLPARSDSGPGALWDAAISWYGAIFYSVVFAALVLATLVAPILLVKILAS